MKKAQRKFRLIAVLSIFVLLTLLLAVINGVNFTMASEDADKITEMLAGHMGAFPDDPPNGENTQSPEGEAAPPSESETAMLPADKGRGRMWGMGPMGPDSPEVGRSVRYFTFAFPDNGDAAYTVRFRMSAVTEDEAEEWAAGLLGEKTGWTRGTYRYRVYHDKARGATFVTVIDQGRELLPSYRILVISAVGEVLCLIISFFVLMFVGRSVFAPIEDADRKQKSFMASADRGFRLPLTVISADNELIERDHGPCEQTVSIRRQVKKLTELVGKLGTMGIFEEETMQLAETDLSDLLKASVSGAAERFAAKGLKCDEAITPGIKVQADPEAMKRVIDELIDNALRYSSTWASFILCREGDRVVLLAQNDTQLPDGQADQVFDRFTKLANAAGSDTAGLGLAYVKEIVKAHHGRVSASVSGGVFTLKTAL